MKKKLTKLSECANEISARYSDHPLCRVLRAPAEQYEEKVTPFKLTLEQMLYVCLWILDLVRRDKCQSSEESDAIFHHLFDIYTEMAPRRCPKKSIAFAALVSLKCAHFCLEALLEVFPSEYDACLSFLGGTIDRYGNAYRNNKQQLDYIFKESSAYEETLWRLDFLPFMKNYMEEREVIFEEMEAWLGKKIGNKANADAEEVEMLKRQIEELKEEKKALEEELEIACKPEVEGKKQFKIRHIVILLEALLGIRITSNETNVSAVSKLISMMSKYSPGSINGKIPSGGLDYSNRGVKRQANDVALFMDDISPEIAAKIRSKTVG